MHDHHSEGGGVQRCGAIHHLRLPFAISCCKERPTIKTFSRQKINKSEPDYFSLRKAKA